MFEDLIRKLDGAIKKIRGAGKLNEKNIAEAMRDIRRVLLEADVNYQVAKQFVAEVQKKALGQEVLQSITPGQQVVKIVHNELINLLGQAHVPIHWGGAFPAVIMVVGLQGSGKTTFAGKLAMYLKKQDRHPVLVAADVYRPAAIEQLKIVGKSSGVPVVEGDRENPLAIAEAGIQQAKYSHQDVLILDTAGRLHIDAQMMGELVALIGKLENAHNGGGNGLVKTRRLRQTGAKGLLPEGLGIRRHNDLLSQNQSGGINPELVIPLEGDNFKEF